MILEDELKAMAPHLGIYYELRLTKILGTLAVFGELIAAEATIGAGKKLWCEF